MMTTPLPTRSLQSISTAVEGRREEGGKARNNLPSGKFGGRELFPFGPSSVRPYLPFRVRLTAITVSPFGDIYVFCHLEKVGWPTDLVAQNVGPPTMFTNRPIAIGWLQFIFFQVLWCTLR